MTDIDEVYKLALENKIKIGNLERVVKILYDMLCPEPPQQTGGKGEIFNETKKK